MNHESPSPPSWFEWQALQAEYLDGTLSEPLLQQAREYLDSAPEERQRIERYRKILTAIASQPRVPLPAGLRHAPETLSIPKAEGWSSLLRRSRWEQAPWFVRTGIEGVAIAFAILLAVAMVPRLRTLYERSIEKRLDSFSLADFIAGGSQDEAALELSKIPLARGKVVPAASDSTTKQGSDDYGGEDTADHDSDVESEDSSEAGPEIRVGNAEVWRFNLKTDSPHEVRARVVQLLRDLRISSNTPGAAGIEAPGGIQFDLIVPQSVVGSIKSQLQKTAGASARQSQARSETKTVGLAGQDAFTWYKVRSRRAIPAGKSRVVIWLSQI